MNVNAAPLTNGCKGSMLQSQHKTEISALGAAWGRKGLRQSLGRVTGRAQALLDYTQGSAYQTQ